MRADEEMKCEKMPQEIFIRFEIYKNYTVNVLKVKNKSFKKKKLSQMSKSYWS